MHSLAYRFIFGKLNRIILINFPSYAVVSIIQVYPSSIFTAQLFCIVKTKQFILFLLVVCHIVKNICLLLCKNTHTQTHLQYLKSLNSKANIIWKKMHHKTHICDLSELLFRFFFRGIFPFEREIKNYITSI